MDGLCRECGYGAGEGHSTTCREYQPARTYTLTAAQVDAAFRDVADSAFSHGIEFMARRELTQADADRTKVRIIASALAEIERGQA